MRPAAAGLIFSLSGASFARRVPNLRVFSIRQGPGLMSHQILMFFALIGPVLLIAAGVIAHVWDWPREGSQAADGESEAPTSGRKR
jgi:hypothetical protein